MLWINRALESLWLLTVVLVPLAFLGRSYGEWSPILGSYELPKIVLLRTFVALMTVLVLIRWGLQLGSHPGTGPYSAGSLFRPRVWLIGLRTWLAREPTHWLGLAVAFYLGSTLLSTVLSASFSVSMWGDIPGQDSYGAYTVAAYVILFGVIATHLRTRPQLWRLLGAISMMGVLVAGYATLQHYGHDFLDLLEPPNAQRVSSTMGNAIFSGAVLLITIPVSVMLAALTMREPLKAPRFWWALGLWTIAITVQLLAMAFTLSRGPWFGTVLALVGFLAITGFIVGWRPLARAVLALGLAVIVTAAIMSLPYQSKEDDAGESQVATGPFAGVVAERVSMVSRGSVSGGIGGRVEVWRGSWRLMTDRPWFSFDTLSLSALRPLIGYGPDLFRNSYLLESPPGFRMLPSGPANAHNYLVHQGVELGFLGAGATLGVFSAVFLIGGAQILLRRRKLSGSHQLVLAVLLPTMAGWLLAQLVGVARVSDLTLSWVLLATFAAIPTVMRDQPMPEDPVPARGRQPRLDRPASRLWAKEALGKRSLLVGLLIASLVVGIGVLTWTKSVNHFRAAIIADRGAQQFRAGQLPASMSSLDRAIGLAPELSSYYDSRSTVYWACRQSSQGRQEDGVGNREQNSDPLACRPEEQHRQNQQWVEKRPFDFRSRLALAGSTLDLGLLNGDDTLIDESTRLYREAAAMVPNGWPVWNRLAEVYFIVGQPGSALAPLEKSLEITGDTEPAFDALMFQADAYQQLGQLRNSIEKSTEAIRHHPRSAQAYYSRGTSYYMLGQPGEALEDLNQAILLNPEYGPAYINRGLANAAVENYRRAVQDYDEAIRLDADLLRALLNRGVAHANLGQLGRAVQDFDRAIDLDPEFAMAYFNRALANMYLGEDSKAREDGRRAVELGLDPTIVEAAIAEAEKLTSPDKNRP